MLKTIVTLIELAIAIVSLLLILNIYFSYTAMMTQITSEYSNMFSYLDKLTSGATSNPTENPFSDFNPNPDTLE